MRRRNFITRDRLLSLLLIAPSLIAIAVFVYGFIGYSAVISFTKWNSFVPNYSWAGFENYRTLFATTRFQIDLRNTLFFTVFFIAGCLGLGLLLAVLIDQKIKLENLFRSIYLFPMAISFIVTGVVWRWLLNPGNQASGSYGIDLLIQKLGLVNFKFGWYTDASIWPGWGHGDVRWFVPVGMIAIVLAAVWQLSGYTMAMYLAGLRGIPEELREAARVDGANELQIYRYIILPILQPITLGAVIILGHMSLKIFDLVVAMTPFGGPGFVTDVPGLNMFKTVFEASRYAQGAAIATIMLVLVAVLVIPYLIFNARTEVQV